MAQAARTARDGQLATAPFDHDPRPDRRTVTITGRPGHRPPVRHLRVVEPSGRGSQLASRMVQVERRRPGRSGEQLHNQPDRLAKWALLMALFLILVVVVSS